MEWHSLTLGELNNCRGAAHQVSAAVAGFEAPRVCVLQGEPWVFRGEAVTHPREKNTRRGLGWVLGKISLQKGGQALEQAALGSAGVTIPGRVEKMCGCGAWGCGSVLGEGLDSMRSFPTL